MTEPVGESTAPLTQGGPASDPGAPDDRDTTPTSGYPAARRLLLRPGSQPGPERRAALARLTDQWLAALLADGVQDAGRRPDDVPTHRDGPGCDPSAGERNSGNRAGGAAAGGPPGVALVAVGGYGRGELSPGSDLDVLLLHDDTVERGELAVLADRVWYPVWDAGLALDHAVRTPAQALATAGEDLKVQLGLLEARHVAGDERLTAGVRGQAFARWRAEAHRRLPELHELCRQRAERHGELSHLLEPDLKEARGGLRDATALRAVAASWVADAPRAGLAEAREHLLDVRDCLHQVTGRAADRLALQEQDQVAAELGLLDADALLRRVYETARTVSYAADVTWREVDRVLRTRSARPRLRGRFGGRGGRTGGGTVERSPLAEGVVEQEGEAVLARTARPDRDPVLVLRAAAAAAQAGLPLSPHAVRRLATAPPLPEPWPQEAREQLVTLLGAGRPMVQVWEALEAEGLISRVLPDWERVRCRPQRNPVHRWTVDRHLVETAVQAAALSRRVGRPDLLLVAALLHDIGKGWPGDHTVVGETIVRDVASRIGFDGADVAVLATLVRHHLLLVRTATRRNLDDPDTVRTVAEAVGSPATLELLHALTEADALATGPAAWSAWRDSLVSDLVTRVADALAGASAPAEESWRATVEQERLAIEAWRTGAPALVLRPRAEQPPGEWSGRPAGESPGESSGGPPGRRGSWRARAGRPARPGGRREAGRAEADPATADRTAGTEPIGVELLVAVVDRPGVLPATAGVLALHRLTVRAADLRFVEMPEELTRPQRPAGTQPPETEPVGPAPAAARPTAAPYAARTGETGLGDAGSGDGPSGERPSGDGPEGPVVPGGAGATTARDRAEVLLLSWRVAAEYGGLPQAARLRTDLLRALDGSLDVTGRLAEREAAYHGQPGRRGLHVPPPRVTVAAQGSQRATVIEVRAADGPGLLHRIGRALEDAGVTVRSAHVSTLGANAVDAFYVTDPTGAPLEDGPAAELADEVERALRG